MSLFDGGLRRRLEEIEESLSPHAARSRLSKGRSEPEESRFLVTGFQRDRDRVFQTKAFRRLMHKTQVFIAPLGDHYTTRLTHTLEVWNLARSIVRLLNLNEDLTEAIVLGHDLGHTPFGHLGEQVLAELVPGGFRHNRQSLRIVDLLENQGRGLNLTWEVRQGILRHSKGREDIAGKTAPELDTLEAQVVKIADALAYISHDLEDAYRADLLTEAEAPQECLDILGRNPSERGNTLVQDIVQYSWEATGLVSPQDGQRPRIKMGPEVDAAANGLRSFLFERVYLPLSQTPQAQRARDILCLLYDHFLKHPQRIPDEYTITNESLERMAVDYISGMTDRYALLIAEQLRPGIAQGMETAVAVPT